MKEQNISDKKSKAALVLLIIMILILLSNFYRLHNAKKASEDMHSIYNDRLVVANYIFQYSDLLHNIKANSIRTEISDIQKQAEITALTIQIHAIDRMYLQTVLTPSEKKHFSSFIANCLEIENDAAQSNWNKVERTSDQAIKTLHILSEIQISEGKKSLEHANSILNENTIWGEFQTALLLVLGAIALYLIKAKKKKLAIPESPSMN